MTISHSAGLGLIELHEPIRLSASIQPPQLPTDCNDLGAGETVMAVGNGITDMYYPNYTDKTLRHGFAVVWPTEECAVAYGSARERDWTICTVPNNGQSAFHGDSGEYFSQWLGQYGLGNRKAGK